MILFINACVRGQSRTKRLAEVLLEGRIEEVTEICLERCAFPRVDEEFLCRRDRLVSEGKLDDPMFDLANAFARADEIVIAAPYWDLSFPAALKQYLELVNVVGITFRYRSDGVPEGLCRAKKLTHVTTAGGPVVPEEFGYGYVKALCLGYYGIPEVCLVQVAGLDIEGADAEEILQREIRRLREEKA